MNISIKPDKSSKKDTTSEESTTTTPTTAESTPDVPKEKETSSEHVYEDIVTPESALKTEKAPEELKEPKPVPKDEAQKPKEEKPKEAGNTDYTLLTTNFKLKGNNWCKLIISKTLQNFHFF